MRSSALVIAVPKLALERRFHDLGPPIEEPEWKPRVIGSPEQIMAAAFLEMKRDYGGPLVAGPAGVRAPAPIR
jgi:hypothetical protein